MFGPGTAETLTIMSARAKMSTQPCAGHPPQSQLRRQAMLGGIARSAVAPSQLCDRCSGRRHFPRAARQQRTSQSMIGMAQLPPRSQEAMQPAPAAAFADAPGNLLPSENIGRPGRCAGGSATCGSYARRRGGDGVAGSSNRHISLPSCAFLPSCIREIGREAVTR